MWDGGPAFRPAARLPRAVIFLFPRAQTPAGGFTEWKKLVLAAIAFAVISQIVYIAGAFADMGYYTDAANASLWSKVMMPGPQPPGMEFYALSIAFSLVSGLVFAYAYAITKQAFALKRSFKADRFWQIGLKFGLFLFLMTSLTGTLSMYLTFAVPSGLLLSWLAQGLVASLAAGVAFAKIIG